MKPVYAVTQQEQYNMKTDKKIFIFDEYEKMGPRHGLGDLFGPAKSPPDENPHPCRWSGSCQKPWLCVVRIGLRLPEYAVF